MIPSLYCFLILLCRSYGLRQIEGRKSVATLISSCNRLFILFLNSLLNSITQGSVQKHQSTSSQLVLNWNARHSVSKTSQEITKSVKYQYGLVHELAVKWLELWNFRIFRIDSGIGIEQADEWQGLVTSVFIWKYS